MLAIELRIIPESAETFWMFRFVSGGNCPQCRPQIRVQMVFFGMRKEDISDAPDTNLRTTARAEPVLRRNRSSFHDHTKCVLDDLLGAIPRVLVGIGSPLVFHDA